MDLNGYTPIFVRADGNDANDGLTAETAKATVQAAFDYAITQMNMVLDVGEGTFAGIVVAAEVYYWPAFRGAGSSSSHLGGINGSGASGYPGIDISVISDGTINLGMISSSGGDDYYTPRSAGSVSLTDCVAESITANGGSASGSGSGGNGGSVTLSNSTAWDITAQAGASYGGSPANSGAIMLTDSTAANLSVAGVANNGYAGTPGGSVTLTRSAAATISAIGGGGGYSGSGGDGGTVTLLDASTAGGIVADGGSTSYYNCSGGNGGSISITDSEVRDCSLAGGSPGESGSVGAVGALTATRATIIGPVPQASVSCSSCVFLNGLSAFVTIHGTMRLPPAGASFPGGLAFASDFQPTEVLGAGML